MKALLKILNRMSFTFTLRVMDEFKYSSMCDANYKKGIQR